MAHTPEPPPFERILAPLDGTIPAEVALRRSEHLLAFTGTRVTLLGVLCAPDDPSRSDLQDRLERRAAELAARGIEATVLLRAGLPSKEILREVQEGRHDLIVMKCRRRSAFARVDFGSTAFTVLRSSPVPVLLYRTLAGLGESFFDVARSEPAKFRKILLMLDGSKEAERIVEPAEKLARAFGSELILFQGVDPRDPDEERVENAREYLVERADTVNAAGIPARLVLVPGDPVRGALRLLDGEADTVALTTRGRSFWKSAVLGSVAGSLLRRAEGPVLCLSSQPVRRSARAALLRSPLAARP